MAEYPFQRGLDPSHQLTERDVRESQLPRHIGRKWKSLARELGFLECDIETIEEEKGNCTHECCMELLVRRWMRQNGTNATAGKLAEALERIELKNLADNLLRGLSCCRCNCFSQMSRRVDPEDSNETHQINKCDRMICEMSNKLRANFKELNKCHDKMICEISDELRASLREEVLRMNTKTKELEEQLSIYKQKCQDTEQEILRMSTRIEETEKELSIAKQECHTNDKQENRRLRARIEIEDKGEDDQETTQVEQVSRLGNRQNESELQEQLSSARQKCQQKEEEILRLNNIIDKLKGELSTAKFGCHDSMQKEDDFLSDTEQADREYRIDGQLKRIHEGLSKYVTSPLQAPVVKQDQLRMAVKLDLLIRLSENLQGLYTEIQGMISEAAKCSEDLRRSYYDLAYHGLRAEHYDLVHRVEDLESALEEMSEEEKKEYERLRSFQKDRQRQVEGLDKVWRRLFSPVDRLPKSAVSDPTSNKSRGSKKFIRHTDPSDRPRKFKLREETDPGTGVPSTSTEGKPDEESRVNLVHEVKSVVGSVFQTISRRKDGGEKQSSSVPYTQMRDA